jgi:hypothetical protein
VKELRGARAIRIATPPLAVLLAAGVVTGVLLSDGGPKAQRCPGTPAGSLRAASANAPCPHRGTADAANGRIAGEAGAAGAPEPGSGAGVFLAGSRAARAKASAGPLNVSGLVLAAQGSPASQPTVASPTPASPTALSGTGRPGGRHAAPGGGSAPSSGPAAAVVAHGAGAPPGSAGPPPRTVDGRLASGQSETGTWSVVSELNPPMEPEVIADRISFSPELEKPLSRIDVRYVDAAEAGKPGDLRSAAIRSACGESGTVEHPTAMPGYLCVYSGLEDFRDRNQAGGIPTSASGAPFVDGQYFAIMKHNGEEGADRYGARIAFGVPDIRTREEQAKGAYPHIIAQGSWAVSAP